MTGRAVEGDEVGAAVSDEARSVISALSLVSHPEGGWYRETWRSGVAESGRSTATSIYFLLDCGGRSHWHRVDAAELWLWHAGHAITVSVADGAEPMEHRLGPDLAAGERPQLVIPPHAWQAAQADGGWALVSCVVSPGFDFAGFELAPEKWSPTGVG